MDNLEPLASLGIALALGLLVGLQREWKVQDQGSDDVEKNEAAAGLRTFGLVGLFGGLCALLALEVGLWFVGIGFAAVVVMVAAAYYKHSGKIEGVGLTGEFALILTYAFGAAVPLDYTGPAAAAAVVTALLLSMKPVLHTIVAKMEEKELYATMKLLLISVVILPILPNRGFGPWEALNPFEIWWMVVLIAGISYVGYFAMKLGGARKGALLTGLLGGLASSTAVTLSLARATKERKIDPDGPAAGILAAGATMFPRMLVVAAALNGPLTRALLVPFIVMAALTYLAAYLLWRRSTKSAKENGGDEEEEEEEGLKLMNPFQLKTALIFAVILTAVLLLGRALLEWLHESGVYLMSVIAGIADVNAITLWVSRMVPDSLDLQAAALALLIAAAVNSVAKGIMALVIGGRALGLRVLVPLVVAIGVGGAVYFVMG